MSWFLWSDRSGEHSPPLRRVRRLPAAARVSGDGRWAEIEGEDGKLERVFLWLELPVVERSSSPEEQARRLRAGVPA